MPESPHIGLVGCGRWGKFILRDLVSLGCRVTVVARSDESKERAHEHGASAIVGKAQALPRVDGLVVATPTSTHARVTASLLDRGVPVFVEKPLATDVAAARRLADVAPDRIFVMDKFRYHPGVEMIGRIARSAELGPVVGLRTTSVRWGNPHVDVDSAWVLGPHELAIALEVLGHIPTPRFAAGERARDGLSSLFGVLGDEPWLLIEVSTRASEHRREIRLHCTEGIAVLPGAYSPRVEVVRGRGVEDAAPPSIERRSISNEDPLLRELQAFINHVRGGPPPRSTVAEGLQVVEAVSRLRALAGSEIESTVPT